MSRRYLPNGAVLLEPDPAIAAAVAVHVGLADPHTQYATDTDLTNHAAAGDPHPGYALESALPAWTTWSPSFSNLDDGAGTTVARYINEFGLVKATLHVTLGAGFSVGAAPDYTLPVTAASDYVGGFVGWGRYTDATSTDYWGPVTLFSSTQAGLRAQGVDSGALINVDTTVPFAWASGDEIHATIVYEAA